LRARFKIAPVLLAAILAASGCMKASSTSAGGEGGGGGSASNGRDKLAGETTLSGYDALPFKNILAIPAGPVKVSGKDKITIGFSQTCFNHPWRKAMLESILAEVARHSNVEVITTDGNCDVAKQSNDIDDLLARGVDAVVMSPFESAGLAPAARRVTQAKIPLIVLDRDVPADKTVFIGQSNVDMGYETAKKMIADLGGKGNIVEITGVSGSSPAVDRSAGLKRALKEAPGIKVLATGDGQWVREPAVKVMEDWLTKFPKIDAVFSQAEESSWGAMQAIANAGRCGDGIKHYTHDGSAPGFKAVKAGDFQADGNYSPFIGDIGIRAALLTLEGKGVAGTKTYEQPGKYLQLPSLPLVTAENADTWIPQGWGTFTVPKNPCNK
jgi:ribose transport system substrate-binding protein